MPEVADSGVVVRPVPVRSLPGHLPREEVIHEPASGACTCPDCGGALRPLGSDVGFPALRGFLGSHLEALADPLETSGSSAV